MADNGKIEILQRGAPINGTWPGWDRSIVRFGASAGHVLGWEKRFRRAATREALFANANGIRRMRFRIADKLILGIS